MALDDSASSAKPPGRVTSREVAAAAGVHQSTVSRALRGDSRISQATREQVEQAARQLGYVPNSSARSLRSQRTGIVGVMVPNIDNAYYPQMLSDINREFAAAGYSMVLIVDPPHRRSDVSRLGSLLDASVDGLLILSATLDSGMPAVLHARGVPIVLGVRSVPGLDVDIMEPDNFSAGRAVAQHLLDLGHSEVAAAMGPEITSTTKHRLLGIQSVLAGTLPPERILHGQYSHEAGYAACNRLLRGADVPTAIIAGNDVIAIGIMDAARQLGVAIPDELSVVGFDDIQMASWHSFRLTTVDMGTAAIAEQSARRLVERIQHADGPKRHELFPASLTVRGTTTAPRKESLIVE
ncbi:MAG: LacI family transcriptional regulator [Acidimicrobiaceae bacterium]|nr:LacI family transcriptional regulator [Acidimicrobiaceae bacterium]